MRPAVRNNLKRLINPQHIAFIGGHDADIALHACQRIGFKGHIWPVNPRRKTMGDLPCFSNVQQLPQPPDAVFLAVPAEPAIEIVEQLAAMGAGGVVCFTAGFGEDGTQGGEADQSLVHVAGDLALVGPNCYGLINFINRSALWPFAHGGYCPGYGAAIITQSGMLSSDITMNQRSLPLAYMISAGNQSVLQLEDFIDVLCEVEPVKCFGLHIEGLKDIEAFTKVAYKALQLNKPTVVLKTGTSKIGSELTISHTGSLSGANELYQALFDRLSIISVSNPAQMLETLKLISVSGIPQGKRIMGFTCSGGGATMLADYAEKIELEFPQPTEKTAELLEQKLPVIADVTNPLDYTTPIWGQADKVQPVFETALEDGYDAAVIVQDFPLEEVNESKPYYLSDTESFTNATKKKSVPAAVCSTLPENIDRQSRELMIENSVAPLQGIHEALDAINYSIWYGTQRQQSLEQSFTQRLTLDSQQPIYQSDEWSSKQQLNVAGLSVPDNQLVSADKVVDAAKQLGFPVVLKVNSSQIAHKTELGAVIVSLTSADEVNEAVRKIQQNFSGSGHQLEGDCFLVEKMLESPLAELMVSVRYDQQFGLALTLSSGGVLVELVADAVTLLLPATDTEIIQGLEKLKVSKLLNGYRGKQATDKHMLVSTIQKISDYVLQNHQQIAELEINPLFVYSDHACIVDVLKHVYDNNA